MFNAAVFFSQQTSNLFSFPFLSCLSGRTVDYSQIKVYSGRIAILNIQNLILYFFIHSYLQKEWVEQIYVPKNNWTFFHICPHFCHHFYKCRPCGASRQSLFSLPACIRPKTISALNTKIHTKSHEEEDVLLRRKDARDLSLFLHSSHTEAWLITVTSENKVIEVFLRCRSY